MPSRRDNAAGRGGAQPDPWLPGSDDDEEPSDPGLPAKPKCFTGGKLAGVKRPAAPMLGGSEPKKQGNLPSMFANVREKQQAAKLTPAGMVNLGNTCYLNSVVQVLLHMTSFNADLQHPRLQALRQHLPTAGHAGVWAALQATATRLRSASSARSAYELIKPAVDPGELRAAMGRRSSRWRGFAQQDAHEFLVELLEALQSEVLAAEASSTSLQRIPMSRTRDPAARNLGGCLMHTWTCTACSRSTRAKEVFSCLSLQLPPTGHVKLQDLMLEYLKEDTITKNCDGCSPNAPVAHTARHHLWRLPRVLVIHIKRFMPLQQHIPQPQAQQAPQQAAQQAQQERGAGAAAGGSGNGAGPSVPSAVMADVRIAVDGAEEEGPEPEGTAAVVALREGGSPATPERDAPPAPPRGQQQVAVAEAAPYYYAKVHTSVEVESRLDLARHCDSEAHVHVHLLEGVPASALTRDSGADDAAGGGAAVTAANVPAAAGGPGAADGGGHTRDTTGGGSTCPSPSFCPGSRSALQERTVQQSGQLPQSWNHGPAGAAAARHGGGGGGGAAAHPPHSECGTSAVSTGAQAGGGGGEPTPHGGVVPPAATRLDLRGRALDQERQQRPAAGCAGGEASGGGAAAANGNGSGDGNGRTGPRPFPARNFFMEEIMERRRLYVELLPEERVGLTGESTHEEIRARWAARDVTRKEPPRVLGELKRSAPLAAEEQGRNTPGGAADRAHTATVAEKRVEDMTEEEQLEYVLQVSMLGDCGGGGGGGSGSGGYGYGRGDDDGGGEAGAAGRRASGGGAGGSGAALGAAAVAGGPGRASGGGVVLDLSIPQPPQATGHAVTAAAATAAAAAKALPGEGGDDDGGGVDGAADLADELQDESQGRGGAAATAAAARHASRTNDAAGDPAEPSDASGSGCEEGESNGEDDGAGRRVGGGGAAAAAAGVTRRKAGPKPSGIRGLVKKGGGNRKRRWALHGSSLANAPYLEAAESPARPFKGRVLAGPERIEDQEFEYDPLSALVSRGGRGRCGGGGGGGGGSQEEFYDGTTAESPAASGQAGAGGGGGGGSAAAGGGGGGGDVKMEDAAAAVDEEEDPELAAALRMSMQTFEQEQRRSTGGGGGATSAGGGGSGSGAGLRRSAPHQHVQAQQASIASVLGKWCSDAGVAVRKGEGMGALLGQLDPTTKFGEPKAEDVWRAGGGAAHARSVEKDAQWDAVLASPDAEQRDRAAAPPAVLAGYSTPRKGAGGGGGGAGGGGGRSRSSRYVLCEDSTFVFMKPEQPRIDVCGPAPPPSSPVHPRPSGCGAGGGSGAAGVADRLEELAAAATVKLGVGRYPSGPGSDLGGGDNDLVADITPNSVAADFKFDFNLPAVFDAELNNANRVAEAFAAAGDFAGIRFGAGGGSAGGGVGSRKQPMDLTGAIDDDEDAELNRAIMLSLQDGPVDPAWALAVGADDDAAVELDAGGAAAAGGSDGDTIAASCRPKVLLVDDSDGDADGTADGDADADAAPAAVAAAVTAATAAATAAPASDGSCMDPVRGNGAGGDGAAATTVAAGPAAAVAAAVAAGPAAAAAAAQSRLPLSALSAYRLCGVVRHKGLTPFSGHYVADVLVRTAPNTQTWYEHNDSVVSQVAFSRVQQDAAQQGYMLFFVNEATRAASDAARAAAVAHANAATAAGAGGGGGGGGSGGGGGGFSAGGSGARVSTAAAVAAAAAVPLPFGIAKLA